MIDAVLRLREAVHAALVADAPLSALLGGPRIFDEAPRAASGPYVTYGDVDARDWSSSSDSGCQQTLELIVWAGQPGATAAALAAAGRIGARLHEAALEITGHRLISLRQTGLTVRRDGKTSLSRCVVTFRALTDRV
jgi:hypothetical protein